MVRVYIEKVLVITKNYFLDKLNYLEKVLQKLAEAVQKVKEENPFFRRIETKYLGFWVDKDGTRPILSNVY